MLLHSLLLFAAVVVSCGGDVYFSSYRHIEGGLWYGEDTIHIPIEKFHTYKKTPDSKDLCQSLGVRYTDKYSYKNLSIEVQLLDGKKVVSKDTVEFDISDNAGEGFCFREQTKPLRVSVPDGDKRYTLCLRHIMQQNPLEGISEVFILSSDCAQHPF